jgi:ATP synthase F1 gamma subunit
MEEKHKLAQEINIASSLQILATAYEEISTMKMRAARDSVLHTRDFLTALSDVFANVKSSYKKKIAEDKTPGKTKTLQFITHKTNGKEVFFLLSATNKLYGDINTKTFQLFEERLEASPDVDIAIVGRVGKELFDRTFSHREYTYFDLPDIIPGVEALKPLISFMLQYEQVLVFYGRFVNIVTQEAVASSISGDTPFEQKEKTTKEFGFIVEPSIEEVLDFFETQIVSSLFKQTIVEAELARLASRIKAMEQAIIFIQTRLMTLNAAERRAKRNFENRKQLERVSGISLWGK